MTLCGLDLGSRFTKTAFLSEDRIVISRFDTASFYREYCEPGDEGLILRADLLGLPPSPGLATTGYGRNRIRMAKGVVVNELRAHALGAAFQVGCGDFLLLDLGGQDSKAARVRECKVVEFATNDRCAASSGRFLEAMAQVLGISLEELGRHWKDPEELSSTCALFGESELIGKIGEGFSIERLASGVNYSIFRRIKPLLVRLGLERIVFVGGVARCQALPEIIRQELGVEVLVPAYPDHNAALGCLIHLGVDPGGKSICSA